MTMGTAEKIGKPEHIELLWRVLLPSVIRIFYEDRTQVEQESCGRHHLGNGWNEKCLWEFADILSFLGTRHVEIEQPDGVGRTADPQSSDSAFSRFSNKAKSNCAHFVDFSSLLRIVGEDADVVFLAFHCIRPLSYHPSVLVWKLHNTCQAGRRPSC